MISLTMTDYIILGCGIVVLLLWLVFFAVGCRHNSMFEVLEEKEYPLKEIYGLGYGILALIHYDYKSRGDRKLRQQLAIIYGEKYVDYYLRVIHSQQITMAFTLVVISFALYGIASDMMAFAVGLMFSGLAYYYFGTVPKNKIQKRSDEMLRDFSEVVSKLALLTNAGMILREAWEDVARGGKGVIYDEMNIAVNEMNNGSGEIDAFYRFGSRCIIPEIKKFASTIIQGLEKGNSELVLMLQDQSKEVWQLKKQLVRREGDKAASKLLIPICIMFIGILIMILIPIFTNLGV